MSNGIVYYNTATGCLARLLVSVYTLRKVYSGNIAILSDGKDSDDFLNKYFAKESKLNVQILDAEFNVKNGKNHHYLSKCRMHEITPFEKSIFLDADTIVLKNFFDLIDYLDEYEFVVPQFSNWLSTGPMISKRILEWKDIKPKDISPALSFGPAVNTGVMAFVKNSGFMKDWFKIARKGRHLFIPDETSCQLVLYKYNHKIVPWYYNASCKYDKINEDVRIVHYHGRKHCREGLPFNGKLWANTYNEVVKMNLAGIQEWTPMGDRKLKRQLEISKNQYVDIEKNEILAED